MKYLFLICCVFLFTQTILSQVNSKTLDYIYLKNGDSIITKIARVTNKKIFYFKTPVTFEVKAILKEKVKGYQFNDEFFQTNEQGNLGHNEVVSVEGYRKDEIYRAIKDWIKINSRSFYGGIRLEDEEHFIFLGTINTPDYLKNDMVTLMSAIDDQPGIQTYSLKYDITIRIKDNRFKIYISYLRIEDKVFNSDKFLRRLYETRCEKDGQQTIQEKEIMRLKSSITKQIQDIRHHCESIREEDEFHRKVVSYILMDNDW